MLSHSYLNVFFGKIIIYKALKRTSMSKQTLSITGADVEKVYLNIEKERKGSFYVQIHHTQEAIPNHIPEKVAAFYNEEIKSGRNDTKLKEDALVAKNIAQGLLG